jgi:alanyl-tRNA synthetase
MILSAFPVDLTNVMAREIGLALDEDGFNKLMNEQKERGREASKDKFASVNVLINDLTGFEIKITHYRYSRATMS